MKYRPITDLTDDEISFIIKEITNAVEVFDIDRDREYETISCNFITGGWVGAKDEEPFEIEDYIEFDEDTILITKYPFDKDDEYTLYQYLMAKGCHHLLRDNPFLE